MMNQMETLKVELRKKYFPGAYVEIKIRAKPSESKALFILDVNHKEYKIPHIMWNQYEELRDHMFATIEDMYPHLIL